MLLEAGADIEAEDAQRRTPLQYIAEQGRGSEVLRLLLEKGIEIEPEQQQMLCKPNVLGIKRILATFYIYIMLPT